MRFTPLLVAASAAVLVSCGAGAPGGSRTGKAAPGWERAGSPPLSARTDPVVAWTGEEVIVVGGNTGWVCPPNADCMVPTDLSSDGAAWNPTTGRWREIAEAPLPLLSGWSCQPCSATVGGRVVVDASTVERERWLAYDIAADSWSRIAPPGVEVDLVQKDGERIWALRGTDVVSWDPATGEVRVERPYDVAPRLDDPRLLLTRAGPVVTGFRYDDAAPDEPALALADLPSSAGWRRVTTGQIGWFHAVVAGKVVGPESGSADGGEVDGWDRSYPQGGMLDPGTGVWEPFDVPGPAGREGWSVTAFGQTQLVTSGSFRDLAGDKEWTATGRPDSRLDSSLSVVWAGDRLFVWGGVDDEQGYDAPAGPEAWTWVPPPAE